MSKPNQSPNPPTAQRLRADIDDGKTGEKIRYPDPAAVPLGTDAEAAGQPPSIEERKQEAESRAYTSEPAERGRGTLLIYALLIVGTALIVFAAYGLLRT
ncbi:hypothetical protein [Chelativorans sp. Marseille-P2723]|uniref:hypothetical protein n=1 Tax=Chelativorans sp. Marseille-P2723 TaxID=2709133 RepID=UPI001570387A|nr:hypothetical protein [Chelativorans sp. Marseille-P2723]